MSIPIKDPSAPSGIHLRLLGQSGCRLAFPGCTLYIDPYLSNSVQQLDAPDLGRLIDIPVAPERVSDANWVLITHEHLDHCDPETLPALAQASPEAHFMGPKPVIALLQGWGVDEGRLHVAAEAWVDLAAELKVHAVPAAHPTIERDALGYLRYVGYMLQWQDKRLYVAGDTGLTQQLMDKLAEFGPVAAAMLPVNEQNFFRARRGIIGNMSVRDAFMLACELGVKTLVPVHWDMFAANSVAPAEIQAVYQQMKPGFALLMNPEQLDL